MGHITKLLVISIGLALSFSAYSGSKRPNASDKEKAVLTKNELSTKKATSSDKAVFTAASEIKWVQPFGKETPIYFGTVHGETFKSAHGTFGKFPPGFTSPVHTHSNGYRAVVLSGVVTNPMAGDKEMPKKMGAGSYWYVPGKSVHETACVSKEPCLFYMYQDTSFDFLPIKENK